MATALVHSAPAIAAETVEKVLLQGDLSGLKPAERLSYYNAVCQSLNLNPLTRPFDYISFKGKTVLYAKRECTEQLRKMHSVSVTIKSRESTEGCYVVTASASLPDGRTDECIGAIALDNLKGEERANALMKAETKAKRRVTLAICGMAFLDESEIGTDMGGSKAAQQEVLSRRLADIGARKAAAQAVPGEPVYEAIPDDTTPYEVIAQEAPSELEQKLRDSIELVERQKKPKRGAKSARKIDMLQAFGELKKRYHAIDMEETYYAVLGHHGVEHSSDFEDTESGLAKARVCFKMMQLNCADMEAHVAKQKETL